MYFKLWFPAFLFPSVQSLRHGAHQSDDQSSTRTVLQEKGMDQGGRHVSDTQEEIVARFDQKRTRQGLCSSLCIVSFLRSLRFLPLPLIRLFVNALSSEKSCSLLLARRLVNAPASCGSAHCSRKSSRASLCRVGSGWLGRCRPSGGNSAACPS